MADYAYLTSTGVIVPDTSDLRTLVENEFKAAFGLDLIVTANTPQGVLITAEVLARDAVLRNNAVVANQINPNLAAGVFLDAIWALTGGERFRATPSLIPAVNVTGTPGAIIPAGSQASVGAAGPLFESVGDVELDAAGNGVIAFQSVDVGPVAAPIGQLTQIVSGVLGWETVTNPTAAILGLAEESDLRSRARRRNTLALQGTALSEAILSAVNDVPGVTSALFRENFTDAVMVIEGVNLEPHSVFVCVSGGLDETIAFALLSKKSLGANWNGTTEITIIDGASGQPYPVKFQRPALIPIYIQVDVRNGSSVPDPAATIRQAILAYADGLLTGEEGFVIGGDVSPFEIGGAINAAAPGLYIPRVLIGTAPLALSTDAIPITIGQRATVIEGDIAVNFV